MTLAVGCLILNSLFFKSETGPLLKFTLAEATIDKSKVNRERDDKVQGFQLSNLNCIDLD